MDEPVDQPLDGHRPGNAGVVRRAPLPPIPPDRRGKLDLDAAIRRAVDRIERMLPPELTRDPFEVVEHDVAGRKKIAEMGRHVRGQRAILPPEQQVMPEPKAPKYS